MSTPYDTDFNRWALEQAAALKAGRFQELDLIHLVEEIEDLSKRQRHAIKSQLIRLLFHLLKWQYQPMQRSASWVSSIQDARTEIDVIIEDSPSLQDYPAEVLESAYQKARRKDSENPAANPVQFPPTCPWIAAQVLADDFWPE